MKKIIPFIILFLCAIGSAQNIKEALQYSLENPQGTARFQAMGGAFGALGGDLSSLNINPAGSAVFSNTLATVSGSLSNISNDATYFGTRTSNSHLNSDINQAGAVFVFKNRDTNSDWKKVSLAFNYDLVKSFENQYIANGKSTQGLDTYFLSNAQGLALGNISRQDGEFLEEAYLDIGAQQGFRQQQAFLGYYGGFINPESEEDSNTNYLSNTNYSRVNQNLSRITSGYNAKYTANIAAQYQDNIYLGASLNFHSIFSNSFDKITESGYNSTSKVQNGTLSNVLETKGSGLSISFGAIAKLNENIRVGGSYQSPTWYRLNDEFSQQIRSTDADSEIEFINFNIINTFETYKIKSPAKLTGSMAIIFGKDGLLSFDYGFQDFSKTKLSPDKDPSFETVNNDILNTLGAVSTFRIGGEYRIKQVSVRAGYKFEQSPYTNDNTIGDLNGISGGLGYNFGDRKLGFSLVRSERTVNESVLDTGITTPVNINRINTIATLSYTVNF